jgi:surface carbohydrate biosynthesis protein (TIGR04326 family)
VISVVVVWDQEGDPLEVSGQILCWRSYCHGDSISSIPRYVEDNGNRLRMRYLEFIHDLGEYLIKGKRVVDHLNIGDGFSLWWMTLLAEKSPFKSPRIYTCLRLLALEEILIAIRPAELALVSADTALAQAIRRLCRNLNIGFFDRRTSTSKQMNRLRRAYDALPYPVKGLLSLRHVLLRWPLRKVQKPQWHSSENAVFICSYFIHLDPSHCARGHFHSRQWEDFPKFLHDSGRPTNWIQLFLFSSVVPDLSTGIRWLTHFNQDARHQGLHRFLESYLTLRCLCGALWNWIWLNVVACRLGDIQSAFNPKASAVWLWPILGDDWRSSLNGPVAIGNCLSIALFDAALADMPRQQTGLYLCENQAWEKALLHAWRRHGHGRIVGVQHATVPFWHLYYFDDPRSFAANGKCTVPLPDCLAVNGAAAWQAFADAGYPKDRLVEVEALRYLYLSDLFSNSSHNTLSQGAVPPPGQVRVLILGDMIPASMDHLLRLLEGAVKLLPAGYTFTLKPHPAYSADLVGYPGLAANVKREALMEILGDYDIALSANSTSAAVDAYVARLTVIIGIDGDALNLSPLRGRPGAHFVSTSKELAAALQTLRRDNAAVDTQHEDFFFLDTDLPRWKRLLPSPAPN